VILKLLFLSMCLYAVGFYIYVGKGISHQAKERRRVASLHPTFNDACVLIHKIEAVLLVLCLTVPSFILKEKNDYYTVSH